MTFRIGTPHTKGAGYFINDKDTSRPQEADIQTCSHCQRVIKMQEWKGDGGFCGKCMHPICGPCATRAMTYGCEPFMKKIEQYAEKSMRYHQFSKIAGLEPVPHNSTPTGQTSKE
jgi:hypothetical protein